MSYTAILEMDIIELETENRKMKNELEYYRELLMLRESDILDLRKNLLDKSRLTVL